MARSFSGASGQHLDIASGIITAVPFSIAVWFKPTTLADKCLVTLGATGGLANNWSLRINSSGNVIARVRTTGSADAVTSTATTTGVYAHALGVWAGNNDKRVYLNGGGKGTEITSRTPTGITQFRVGTEADDSAARYAGLEGYLAIWNTALSDTDASNLYGLGVGANPQSIPGLVGYWTLDTNAAPEVPVVGVNNLAVTGTTYSSSNPTVSPYGNLFIPSLLSGGFQELLGGF